MENMSANLTLAQKINKPCTDHDGMEISLKKIGEGVENLLKYISKCICILHCQVAQVTKTHRYTVFETKLRLYKAGSEIRMSLKSE